jgi:hypothetical protein
MGKRGWLSLACALVLGACVVTPRGVYAPVRVAPPPERAEVMSTAPGPNYFWIRGHWAWEGDRHVWVPGHWEARRTASHWVPARWVQNGPEWEYVAGHWESN